MILVGLDFLNFALFVSRAAVAGEMLNDVINGDASGTNGVIAPWVIVSTLIVTMIGVAATGAGAIHYTEWTDGSRAIAVGAGAVVAFLDMLVFGLACKAWQVGGDLSTKANFLGGAAIAQVITNLIFILLCYLDWPTCFLKAGFRAAGKQAPASDPHATTKGDDPNVTLNEEA